MKNNYIIQAWLVLLLATGFGAALAGVQYGLRDRIAANKLADTMSQIPLLVPGAKSGEPAEGFGELLVYKALGADGQLMGWVIRKGDQGFADIIELLIGVGPAGRDITGIYVLDQKETPGLGNKIIEESWRKQFEGKQTTPPLVVVKSAPTKEDDIEAVTGATISSEAVIGIVNKAVAQFKALLQKGGSSS